MKGIAILTIMKRLIICSLFLPFLLLTLTAASSQSTPSEVVVHAVLFYSPTCAHCEYVITEALPPIFEKYGDQLSMVGIDISQSAGYTLFMNALKYFNIEQGGVPFLVVGDTYLVGSVDIPNQFPGLIDHYLAQGGVDWPTIPGLAEVINAPTPTEAPSATPVVTEISTALPTSITPTSTPIPGLLLSGSHTPSVGATFANDPLGNSLAVVVLVAMILSVGGAILVFQRTNRAKLSHSWGWLIPILCVIGLLVAGYLAYVETSQVEAICGPIGDCNTVQQSEYARLFGILPVGILGVADYGMILLAWVIEQFSNKRKAAYASLAIFGMSGFGVLFSIYLTFLEPFVIGATCAWCLTSSIIMTALLWLSIFPGKRAYISLFLGEKHAFRKRSSQRTF
jgi:uncharacterized membrane protein/thiol-disulfide isomerase/thioredoxin